jgi:lysophospholipase L1-like esterase
MKRILLPIIFAVALLVFPTACSHTHPVSTAAPKTAASPPAAPTPVAPTATVPTTAQNTNVVTFNTATNPVPRDSGWIRRHEGFVRQAQTNNIDILFLGDSITDFWRNRGLSVWNQYYAPRHAADFGISGDRTQHVLWRVDHGELDGIHPKVVVLMIGTNNTGSDRNTRRNTVPEVAEGVQAVVNDIRARLPDSKILLLGIFPRATLNNSLRAQVALINTLIAKLDDGKVVKYLDIGSKFLEFDGTLPRSIMPDALHPNAKGYQIWAEAMEPTLDEMLK